MPSNAYKIQFFSLFLAVFLVFAGSYASAQEPKSMFSATGFPIPRFVSLSSDKVYMRSGPGTKYPVLWEYNRKGLPVEITMEFDVWRKIKDIEGTEGWVHKSLLSGRRYVIVQGDDLAAIKRKPSADARLMAYIEPGAIAAVEECSGAWCKVSAQGYEGWSERNLFWGVYPSEEFD